MLAPAYEIVLVVAVFVAMIVIVMDVIRLKKYDRRFAAFTSEP